MQARRIRLLAITGTISAALAAAVGGSAATAFDDAQAAAAIQVQLTGYEEDPLVISTRGRGQFQANIDERRQEISYRLSYTALEGSITQAHIHLGGRAQSGGVSAFLCSNLEDRPAGTQACPAGPATITGTIRPANVVGPAAQGIAPGEFIELVRAIRAGATYVNVHSTLYPGGEIRGQLGHHH